MDILNLGALRSMITCETDRTNSEYELGKRAANFPKDDALNLDGCTERMSALGLS